MEKTKNKKNDVLGNTEIVFRIDNNWTPVDFIRFFKSIEFLYRLHCICIRLEKIIESEKGIKYGSEAQIPSNIFAKSWYTSILSDLDYNPLDPFSSNLFSNNANGIDKQLTIKKVMYSSPGSIDLVGFGKAFEVIKQLCFKYLPNKTDKLKNEKLALENLEKKITLLKKLGFTDLQLQSIVLKEQTALSQIENLIDGGKIVDINLNRNN